MNAHVNVWNGMAGDESSRDCSEWPAGYRLIGPIAAFVLLALALGTAQWAQSSGAPSIDVERLALEVGNSAGQFEYFPARYANQAKQPEEHIQAF